MVDKSRAFVIQVLSKQINTKEELDELCRDLDSSKVLMEHVTFTGNSYGLDACTRIAQILEACQHLNVS